MAETQTGALIVIKGSEQWERHIDGGIELNGELSIPLLFSIFNPKAPGHDGAVLLEGNQIVRFSTHLPLSKNINEDVGGTRHAAALGLSEHCDAIVIVVSEESGNISVADSGSLQRLGSNYDLKNILDEFWSEHYQTQGSSLTAWWKKRDLRTAVASVLLAFLLWFSFAYQPETAYRSFSVPIEYTNLQSSSIALQDSIPMEARVTLSGPEQAFRTLDPSELLISFNMKEEGVSSDELVIDQNNINLPNNLQLYESNPKSLEIEARPIERLPVKIPLRGELPDNIELISVEAETETISVIAGGPNQKIPDSIATETVDLSTIDQSTQITKELVLPSGIKLTADTLKQITVDVKVRKKSQ